MGYANRREWLPSRDREEVAARARIGDVHINDVKDTEIVLLSNGVRGTWGATVRRSASNVQ